MKRCVMCRRYNVFDSKGRTEKIQYLISHGYNPDTLHNMCIDCINKEYEKIKDNEYFKKAADFIIKSHHKKQDTKTDEEDYDDYKDVNPDALAYPVKDTLDSLTGKSNEDEEE